MSNRKLAELYNIYLFILTTCKIQNHQYFYLFVQFIPQTPCCGSFRVGNIVHIITGSRLSFYNWNKILNIKYKIAKDYN